MYCILMSLTIVILNCLPTLATPTQEEVKYLSHVICDSKATANNQEWAIAELCRQAQGDIALQQYFRVMLVDHFIAQKQFVKAGNTCLQGLLVSAKNEFRDREAYTEALLGEAMFLLEAMDQ